MRTLALVNGTVAPLAQGTPEAEAILIDNGIVRTLGTTAEITGMAPDATFIDLHGRTVLPGLIDAHTHVEFCALSRQDWLDVRAQPRSVTLTRLAAAADVLRTSPTARDSRWLVAQGTYGQDLPSRDEIDAVVPDLPVLVRESMHRLTANSAALLLAGMKRGFTAPIGTLVEIGSDGVPSGLVEEGYHLFPVPSPPPAELQQMLRTELVHSFARHGVTTIYELPATEHGIRAYQQLKASGSLPTRLSLNLTVAPGLNPILDSVSQLSSIGLATGFGDEQLWLGGMKVFLDGDDTSSLDSAHLKKSPSEWGTGTRLFSQIVELIVQANSNGLQVWLHAIGDVAQGLAIDAIEQAVKVTDTTALRTRIEHAGNLQLTEDFVQRLAELNVIPVPTAAFMFSDPGTGVYAFRTLIEAGLRPPGNSDTGGTQPFATNPWFGIAAMMKRQNQHGTPVSPDERVDVHTALRSYTEFAAEAGFRERTLGALAPGMLGDCAVYAKDPRTMTVDELEQLEADLTFVGGVLVWDRNAAAQ